MEFQLPGLSGQKSNLAHGGGINISILFVCLLCQHRNSKAVDGSSSMDSVGLCASGTACLEF